MSSGRKTKKDRVSRTQRGTAAVEMALALPLFLCLLAGLLEIGFAAREAMQAQNAAEAGVGYAVQNGWNAAAIATAVENATTSSQVTADPAPALFCGCPGAGGVTAVSCNGDTCSDGAVPGEYVRVGASIPHTTIIGYLGLPIPDTLTATAVVRIIP